MSLGRSNTMSGSVPSAAAGPSGEMLHEHFIVLSLSTAFAEGVEVGVPERDACIAQFPLAQHAWEAQHGLR